MERCAGPYVSGPWLPAGGRRFTDKSYHPHSQIGVITESGNAAGDPAAEAGNSLARTLRDSWAATTGYPELSVYVNYARGDEKLRQRYGSRKLPRLAALKKKWDPRNVFAYNNVLPMEYDG